MWLSPSVAARGLARVCRGSLCSASPSRGPRELSRVRATRSHWDLLRERESLSQEQSWLCEGLLRFHIRSSGRPNLMTSVTARDNDGAHAGFPHQGTPLTADSSHPSASGFNGSYVFRSQVAFSRAGLCRLAFSFICVFLMSSL